MYVTGPRAVVVALPDSIVLSAPEDTLIRINYRSQPLEPASKPITLKLTPGNKWPAGAFRFTLQMRFDGERAYEVSTPIMGSVAAPISVRPSRLYLVQSPDGASVANLLISSPWLATDPTVDCRSLSISADVPVTWVVHPREPGSQDVRLSIRPAGDVPMGLTTGHLQVHFLTRSEPLIIPVALASIGQPSGSPASAESGDVKGPNRKE
jgi:hypothetical protein